MNRLTVICKVCGAHALTLDALPAVIQLVLELMVKLGTSSHGALHPAGTNIQFDVKIEPVLIEAMHIAVPPQNPRVN